MTERTPPFENRVAVRARARPERRRLRFEVGGLYLRFFVFAISGEGYVGKYYSLAR